MKKIKILFISIGLLLCFGAIGEVYAQNHNHFSHKTPVQAHMSHRPNTVHHSAMHRPPIAPAPRIRYIRPYVNVYYDNYGYYYGYCNAFGYDPFAFNCCMKYGPMYCSRAGFRASVNISL